MSLADRVNSIPDRPNHCRVCAWYNTLPPEERAALDSLIGRIGPDPGDLSKSQLHRWCEEEGLRTTVSSFKRHLHHHEPH